MVRETPTCGAIACRSRIGGRKECGIIRGEIDASERACYDDEECARAEGSRAGGHKRVQCEVVASAHAGADSAMVGLLLSARMSTPPAKLAL